MDDLKCIEGWFFETRQSSFVSGEAIESLNLFFGDSIEEQLDFRIGEGGAIAIEYVLFYFLEVDR